jgi:flagellar hook-length control protein FliK
VNDAAYTALSFDGGQSLLETVLASTPEELARLFAGQTGAAEQPAEPQAQTTGAAKAVAEAEITQYAAAPKADFAAAVRSTVARFERKDPAAEKQAEPLDVDALQQRVDAGDYLRNTRFGTAGQAAENLAGAEPPETQLYQPVQAAIQNGSEEITVKLNPEELGEVTVKLAKNAEGRIILDLIAKRPETQQLLAAQAQELQESLKTLRVEVDSILTERQYELLSHQQSFDQGQRQAYNPNRAAYFTGGQSAVNDPFESLSGPPPASASVLDTYI